MSEELLTSRDNELEIVKTAYYIEKTVQDLKSDYRQLTRNPYNRPREPREPALQEVKPLQPNYPVISPPEELFKESREAIRREKNRNICWLRYNNCILSAFSFLL